MVCTHFYRAKIKKSHLPQAQLLSQVGRRGTENYPIQSTDAIFPISTEYTGGGAMVLGKLPVPGRPTILITVGQGPIALAVGAGGGGLDIFTLIYPLSPFSLSLGDGPI